MTEEMKHKCGVFAIWGDPYSAEKIYTGIFAQQHRGQESAGIAVTNGEVLDSKVGMGLVSDVFTPADLKLLKGKGGIGHNRYSTTGESKITNAQPIVCTHVGGEVAVAHNGNLINANLLRRQYEKYGHIFHTTTDTEIILHLLAYHHLRKSDPMVESLPHLEGAYSLVFLFKDRIEAVRDPWGWRPLVLGKTADGHHCVASETVALDAIGARFIREIEPGEIVTLSDAGVSSRRFSAGFQPAHCIFEHIYFANPSSRVFGDTVQIVRERLGEQLAKEFPADADLVIPMPDSGRSAALGFARQSQLPFREGIVPNRYVGRTFIQPTHEKRTLAVQLKLNVVAEVVEGKRVVVVDDSVVRGTTTQGKMKQLRNAGAKEIHLRISCPAIRNACHFGIDFPHKEKLLATGRTIEQIREFLEVESIEFLSLGGMLSCVSRPPSHYCTGCFSGEYRLDVNNPVSKLDLEQNQLRMFPPV